MIALITGATSGIGKACAEILSKNGYKTILIGRRNEKLQSLSKKLNVSDLKVFPLTNLVRLCRLNFYCL